MKRGEPIRVEMTKWGGLPHWEFDGVFLGTDETGTWLGFPRGTAHARPGRVLTSEVDSVTVLPHAGWWIATFHGPGTWCEVYVDIATAPVWDGHVARSVDLDLDVIRRSPGGATPRVGGDDAYVDDEDEFLDHQVALGYPPEVIRAAEAACIDVLAAVRAETPPFDRARSADWLAWVPGPT